MRWGRGHKFLLTPSGIAAEVSYRASIIASRTDSERRTSFDAALGAWARPLNVGAEDGTYLSELAAGPISFGTLLTAFESSGRTPEESKSAIERLMAAGLVAPAGGG